MTVWEFGLIKWPVWDQQTWSWSGWNGLSLVQMVLVLVWVKLTIVVVQNKLSYTTVPQR